jgi:glycosyltransferase involved in cell wall biosynthesis
MRLLMLGSVNHPHVEHLALGMAERGFEVVVAGDRVDILPDSVLPAAGIRVVGAPPVSRSSPRGVGAHVRWVRRLLREVRPDVVHANWMPGFAFHAALAGARPLVAMAWGSDVLRTSRAQHLAASFAARRADLVMADSQALVDATVRLGAKRTMLVQWGVDLERFSPPTEPRGAIRARLGLGPGPLVLSPRSVMPVYNIPTIVEAFGLLAADRPDLQLSVKHMGTGEPDLGPLPYPDRVHVIGHVPHEQLADHYRAADVCVSVASSDSSPRSAWESLACGTPLVVSDLPWVHELLEHERSAMVVPIEAEAIAAAIARVLDEPELASRLQTEGRRLVEEHHDRRREMDRVADAYRDLV